jgi:hypothetical protein
MLSCYLWQVQDVHANIFRFSVNDLGAYLKDITIKICHCDANWYLIQDGPQFVIVHSFPFHLSKKIIPFICTMISSEP